MADAQVTQPALGARVEVLTAMAAANEIWADEHDGGPMLTEDHLLTLLDAIQPSMLLRLHAEQTGYTLVTYRPIGDPEVDAMQLAVIGLRMLGPERQARVVDYLYGRYTPAPPVDIVDR